MSTINAKEAQLKVKKIQDTIYPILCEIDSFCTEKGIQYFLCAGSCLGAVRHKGFIPWDDDADIMLPRQDYDRFIEEYSRYKERKYQIGAISIKKDWNREFCRVWNDKTSLHLNKLEDVNLGVFVDVFPIDGFPTSKTAQRMYLAHMKILSSLGLATIKSEFFEGEKYRFLKKVLKVVLKPLGMRYFAKKMDKLARKYPFSSSKYVGVGIAPGYGKREIMPKSALEKETRMRFVDRDFSIPLDYNTYLSNLYGNYMEIPKNAAENGYTHLQDWDIEL